MTIPVKTSLRPFEYMAWANTVAIGARHDLSASGMPDTLAANEGDDGLTVESFHAGFPAEGAIAETIAAAELCRRDHDAEHHRRFAEAVAERYRVDADRVCITLGASLAITHALMALVRAGDHVIVERPTYEALHRAPELFGARVSRLERTFEEDWAVVPERVAQLLGARTRAVVLSNLHNPSGVGIDVAALEAIAGFAARVGAMVLVDEVYLDFAFSVASESPLRPACTVAPNCISWSSCTKAFGFGAVRAGWIVAGDREAAKVIRSASDYLHVQPPISTSILGRRVLEQSAPLEARAQARAHAGRRIVERWLETEKRVTWVRPTAGLTALVRLPDFTSDVQFTEHLRKRYDTQVAPGSMFEAPGFVRLGFGASPGALEQGLTNISAALDDFHR